ncbi:MAG: hypothetical protein LVS60_13475 [Nodosilinea sp. LVE1205-7]
MSALTIGIGVSPARAHVFAVEPRLPSVVQRADNSQATPPLAAAPSPNRVQGNDGNSAQTILQSIVSTGDGFLLQFRGSAPDQLTLQVRGDSPDDRTAVIDLPNTAVATDLRSEDLPAQRYGVISWEVLQQPTQPASTRITLKLASSSPDWRVIASSGGIILLPPWGYLWKTNSLAPVQGLRQRLDRLPPLSSTLQRCPPNPPTPQPDRPTSATVSGNY